MPDEPLRAFIERLGQVCSASSLPLKDALDQIDRDLRSGVPSRLVDLPIPPGWPVADVVLRALVEGTEARPGLAHPVPPAGADLRLAELERQRLARELHDETGQLLAVSLIQIDTLLATTPDSDPKLRAQLERVREALRETWHGVRRIAHRLRPPMLEDAGLGPTLHWLAQRFEADHGIPVAVEVDGVAGLSPDLELALYRIVQESLTNVARHARARSVRVELRDEGDAVTCTIEDDGAGFDVARVLGDPTRLSLGLRGVRARSRQFDGEVRISSAAGRGTRVEAVLRDTHRSDESDVVARRGRT